MGSFTVDQQDGTNESARTVSLNAVVDAGNSLVRYQKQTDLGLLRLHLFIRFFNQSVCLFERAGRILR